MATTPIKVLIVEDRIDDAELMIAELARSGFKFNWSRVENEKDYRAHLSSGYDVILADFSLPQFGALAALTILREQNLDIPFIIVSGSITEESAIESMKRGATDYLLKDRTARLGSAVSSALRAKDLRDERHRAVSALAESEARFRRLVEAAPDVIYRYNLWPEPGYEYISPSIQKVLGYSPAEFYGDPDFVYKIIHPEDLSTLQGMLGGKSGVREPIVRRWIHADSSVIWMEESAVPILDVDGLIIAVEGISRDISERYLMAEELRRANRALQTIIQCNEILTKATSETELLEKVCITLTESGGYRLAWVAFADYDEAKSAHVVACAGHDPGYIATLDLSWGDSEGGYGVMGGAIRSGRPVVSQNIAEDPNFKAMREAALARGYQSAIGLPLIFDGRVGGALALYATTPQAFDPVEIGLLSNLADDIAFGVMSIRAREDSKRAHEALVEARLLRMQLEKEMELSELKSRFITIASHEFRTPLSTILTSSDLLRLYGPKLSEDRKLDHLERIQAAVRYMTGLMDDVLTLGKIESERMRFAPTPIELEDFTRNLVDEIRLTVASKHTLNFSTRGMCGPALMDEKLVRQILTNLITNAIKYSPAGGNVRVELNCADGWAEIFVHDDGIGIPEEDWPHLYETFFRATNVGTIPGTGLGLPITKSSVELHGGEMRFLSEQNVGTTFIVRLPLTPPEAASRPTPEE